MKRRNAIAATHEKRRSLAGDREAMSQRPQHVEDVANGGFRKRGRAASHNLVEHGDASVVRIKHAERTP